MKHLVVITFYFVCIIMGCTANNDIYSYVKEQVEMSGNQISFNKFSEENGFEWDTLSVEFNKAKGISISASDTILKCTPMDAIFNIEKKNDFFILTPQ